MKSVTMAICIMLAGGGCATNNQVIDAGSQSLRIDVPAAAAVRVQLPVGEVVINGVAGSEIRASVEMSCEDGDSGCHRRAEKAEFVSRADTSTISISLLPASMFAWRDVHARIEISVPRDRALFVKMGAGELDVNGMHSCVELDMYAGDAAIRVQQSAVGSVMLDVGTGDTSLLVGGHRIEGKRALLVGAELEWSEGGGWCQIYGDLQFGDLTVYME